MADVMISLKVMVFQIDGDLAKFKDSQNACSTAHAIEKCRL